MSSKKADDAAVTVSISGNNSGVIAGRDVIINQGPPPREKVKAYVPVGPEHISNEQRVILQGLVAEIVRLEGIAKQKPKGLPAVWGSLNTRCKVSEYKLILRSDFPKAEKYLRSWIGRLSNTKTAQKKDESWRKRKIAFIHVNCKKIGLEPKMREFIQQKFQAASLTELSDEEIKSVYGAVSKWKGKTG